MDRRTFAALVGVLPFLQGCSEERGEDRRRYAADNRAILASGRHPGIVFFGDSITENWARLDPAMFRAGRVCRGISGQTTPQMIERMTPDVIALKPRFVHIMAGTNDVAGNSGPMTVDQTCANLAAMVRLARTNEIDVILASVPPALSFPWRRDIKPLEPIRAINRWITTFAGRERIGHVDYTPVLADSAGGLRKELGEDGVHPNAAGYRAMHAVLKPMLRERRV